jgi:hypothetical protein
MRTALLWSTLLLAACTGAPTSGTDASTDAPDVSLDVAEVSLDAPDVPVEDDVPTDRVRVVPTTWSRTPPPLRKTWLSRTPHLGWRRRRRRLRRRRDPLA